jgi:hypothetical protein
MAESIEEGDECFITHEILVDGLIAFRKGERVVIEEIDPDEEMPLYRYGVYSKSLPFERSALKLRGSDLTTDESELGAAEPPPASDVPVFKPIPAHLRSGVAEKSRRGDITKWIIAVAVVLAVVGGIAGFVFASRAGNTGAGQVDAVEGYLHAMKSGNEGGASLYWAYEAVPQNYFNVLNYKVLGPSKDGKGNIYVTARITSNSPDGSSVNKLWDFLMFRDSTTGEWRIQDIKPVSQ